MLLLLFFNTKGTKFKKILLWNEVIYNRISSQFVEVTYKKQYFIIINLSTIKIN